MSVSFLLQVASIKNRTDNIRLNSETGNIQIAELRSGSPDFKWKWFKELVKDHGTALPGTSIATNLTNPTTHLFFQDHAGNISEYLGGYDTWYSM